MLGANPNLTLFEDRKAAITPREETKSLMVLKRDVGYAVLPNNINIGFR